MDFQALYRNWQYLNIETLKHNLLNGVWYDHTQPPIFNIFLGFIIKLSGSHAPLVFSIVFKVLTLLNSFLLLRIIKQQSSHKYIPIFFTILYLLSPATMLFENELFYTTFVSLLLLVSCNFLTQYQSSANPKNIIGFLLAISLICLTRSMYHLVWLLLPVLYLIIYHRKQKYFRKLLFTGLFFIVLVSSWYVKNYQIFGKFTASTWQGMNIARNVFHDVLITDSAKIAAIEPFSKISAYKKFLLRDPDPKFRNLNDRDLMQEYKNDTFINEKHISYIKISDLYMQESKLEIKNNPAGYLKNVVQSSIIFFTPATRYPVNELQARKLKYYDLFYSFNLSQLAQSKQERRIALTLSALPKLAIYLFVFFLTIKNGIRRKHIPIIPLFIIYTIAYVFCISSLFEHYENMRFRFEVEPLFLILTAMLFSQIKIRNVRKNISNQY